MADENDVSVDEAIQTVQKALDDLKARQKRDDQGETTSTDLSREKEPADLKAAAIRVRAHFRAARRKAQQPASSEKSYT